MALTQRVIAMASAAADGRPVTVVRLEVGRLSGVLPDAMRFCFEAAVPGTPLEEAVLEITEPPGVLRCHACGLTSPCPDLVRLCPCGSADVEIASGEGLRLISVDLLEEAPCA